MTGIMVVEFTHKVLIWIASALVLGYLFLDAREQLTFFYHIQLYHIFFVQN